MRLGWKAAGLLSAFFVVPAGLRAELALKETDRVILFGDRAFADPFTLSWIDQFLRIRYPEFKGEVYRMGREDSTAANGNERLAVEVMPFKPTHVVLCFGLDDPQRKALDQARLDEFVEQMRKMIETFTAANVNVTLMTPPPPDERKNRGLASAKFDTVISAYADAVRVLAEERKLPLLDWNKAMKAWLEPLGASPDVDWTEHGLVPAPISQAIATDLLLAHWGAEPLDYLVELDWRNPEPCKANIGSVEVTERTSGKLELVLKGSPVPLEPRGRGALGADRWPLAKWCVCRLKLTGVPEGGVVISSAGQAAKPFLATQLAEGADLTMVGPLVDNEAAKKFYLAIGSKLVNMLKAQTFQHEKAPEPELEKGYEMLKDAYREIALAAHRIAYRTPVRIDLPLTIELASEAMKNAPPPKTPTPPRPVRKPANR
jgi:hypothetical protein